MKRFVTLATVLLVGLASVQAAQTDDQQKKKKKKAQTTQTATPAAKTGAPQTSKRHVSSETGNRHVSSQTSSNQQVTNRSYKKAHANGAANRHYYNPQNSQRARKSQQTNV